jgi:hypothetical protein
MDVFVRSGHSFHRSPPSYLSICAAAGSQATAGRPPAAGGGGIALPGWLLLYGAPSRRFLPSVFGVR